MTRQNAQYQARPARRRTDRRGGIAMLAMMYLVIFSSLAIGMSPDRAT